MSCLYDKEIQVRNFCFLKMSIYQFKSIDLVFRFVLNAA